MARRQVATATQTQVSVGTAFLVAVAIAVVPLTLGLYAALIGTTLAKDSNSRQFQMAVTLGDTVNQGLSYGTVVSYGGGLGDMVNSGLNYSTIVGWGNPQETPFVRGDANGNGRVDISDGVTIRDYVVCMRNAAGCEVPTSLACRANQGLCYVPCLDAYDANDNGVVDMTDSQYIVNFQLYGGARPPLPYPTKGIDPTRDSLMCYGR